MIYAVIKNKQVISFLLQEQQITFLQSEDADLNFAPLDIEWDINNPILLSQCAVQDDGSITILPR